MQQPHPSVERSVELVEKLRQEGAVVHCITNTVAQFFSANVLLACGASPSMTASRDEAALFAGRADALLVNLGTLDAERRDAMTTATAVARERGIPVVVDPVKCEVSPLRAAFARDMVATGPAILKMNRAEAECLGDVTSTCRIITGPTDKVVGAGLSCEIANGHPLMDRVIATGCALGALTAALATKTHKPEEAALAALLWFNIAGEMAAEQANGPGSFVAAFVDTLAWLRDDDMLERARIA